MASGDSALRGAAIRAQREALGQTLEDLAAATRIPVAHLEAIEADRLDELPEGPWAAAYVRTLIDHLKVPEPSEDAEVHEPPPVPPAGAPLWLVRAMAMVSVLALFLLLGSAALQRLRPDPDAPIAVPVPDQHLVVTARRTTHLDVIIDGQTALSRAVAGGEQLEFEALDRIDVMLPAIADVTLSWNGTPVVPQGRQDAPRRLVFVDDQGSR